MGRDDKTYLVKLVSGEIVEVFGEPTVNNGVLTIREWFGYGGQSRVTSFSLVNVLWWKAKDQ